ncbi:MAG: N-acetylneuraminate synthase family protein [Phycisphaerales bacterium]|nr:MAG: N-acetylneuraminate synthase family protein [Phycisphaerales bacterium]
MPLSIGAHESLERRAFVVAEAGVNHDGSEEQALKLVDSARLAGADAVKFQVFSADRLVSPGTPTAAYQRGAAQAADQGELLARLELDQDTYGRIAQHCRAIGIEFLATPFDPLDLEFLLTLDVPAIKIASTDLTNRPLVGAAFASGLPVLLSTGTAVGREIDRAVAWYRRAESSAPLVLLHCVSSYPTPPEEANLRAIETLGRRYGLPVGYSDHTTSAETGALALAAGARVIEKHLTLDRTLPGPDHATSLEPDALADYVARIRQAEAMMGSGRLCCAEIEKDVRRVGRRSIVAKCDIAAGQTLTSEVLTVKRPSGGIDPGRFDEVLCCQAVQDIPRDTPLTWQMLRSHPTDEQAGAATPRTARDSLPDCLLVPSTPTVVL